MWPPACAQRKWTFTILSIANRRQDQQKSENSKLKLLDITPSKCSKINSQYIIFIVQNHITHLLANHSPLSEGLSFSNFVRVCWKLYSGRFGCHTALCRLFVSFAQPRNIRKFFRALRNSIKIDSNGLLVRKINRSNWNAIRGQDSVRTMAGKSKLPQLSWVLWWHVHRDTITNLVVRLFTVPIVDIGIFFAP